MKKSKNYIGIVLSLLGALLIIIIDQVSKYLIVNTLVTEGNTIPVIRGFLNFTLSYNDGMAFGLGSDSFRWIFVTIMIVVGAVLIYLMFNPKYNSSKIFLIASSLLIGGGIGNAIDRVMNGYVIDFLALSFFPPVCNIADYAITVGTGLLLIYVVFIYGKSDKSKVNEPIEFVSDNSDE